MKKKVIVVALAVAVVLGGSTTIITRAFENASGRNSVVVAANNSLINEAKRLTDVALNKKTFYDYNMAYQQIMNIDNISVRDELLGKLGTISDEVYTSEILDYLERFTDIAQNGSGKVYDETEAILRQCALYEYDKEYLLGELTSWGRQKVYTSDYKNAVDKVVYAWKMLAEGTETNLNNAIIDAESSIARVKNTYSRQYLADQLDAIKLNYEFTVIDIK